MVKPKLIIPLVISGILLIAGSAFAYYQYTSPKEEKQIVLAAKITPTPTIFPSSTPTATPSSTPTPIIKYIYKPTATPAPDFKQVLNDYEACKQACPVVAEGENCTENNGQPQPPVCETIKGPDGTKSKCMRLAQ